jgi:ankyrin repeat protein
MTTITKPIKKIHHDIDEAIENKDLDALKALLAQKPDLTESWTTEWHPMDCVEASNQLDAAKLLVEAGCVLYNLTTHELSHTELCYIEKDLCGLNWRAKNHETSLYLLGLHKGKDVSSGLISLAKRENEELNEDADIYFDKLFEMGLDIDELNNMDTILALYLTCTQNDRYTERLINMSKDINRQENPKQLSTPLAAAVRKKSKQIVTLLLAKGADVHLYDHRDKESLLDYAMYWQKQASWKEDIDWIIEELKAHGAKTYQQMLDDGDIEEPSGDDE